LDYVAKLDEVDTTDVPPTFHAVALTNAFRDDVVHDHLSRQAALSNAPSQDDGSFVVPKVI
jgi:aspartyl-tRNA(Asn)/glutamyl-tRNA(Gln) amidotransferase subunit C